MMYVHTPGHPARSQPQGEPQLSWSQIIVSALIYYEGQSSALLHPATSTCCAVVIMAGDLDALYADSQGRT